MPESKIAKLDIYDIRIPVSKDEAAAGVNFAFNVVEATTSENVKGYSFAGPGAQHLPFLRRYARAVTGSQRRGDEWVRLCAEVAMRQPELIANSEDTKLGVFSLFHRLRQPFGTLEEGAGEDSVSGRLKESLTDMAPLQRQVLLLTVLIVVVYVACR